MPVICNKFIFNQVCRKVTWSNLFDRDVMSAMREFLLEINK